MTPNDIDVLLHYHCMATPHPRVHAPAVEETIRSFCGAQIFKISKEKKGYELTSRGEALVKMLCDTPFPKQRWIDPREKFYSSKVQKLLDMDYLETEKRVFVHLYGDRNDQ